MSGVAIPNAPGVYTNVQPPPYQVQGVPTDIIGFVGIASWGPKNVPMTLGNMADAIRTFGPMQNALMDIVTSVYLAMQEGANAFLGVRVTDGTDTAASVELMDTATTPAEGALLTALYTGTVGNTITAAITVGSVSGTYTLTITRAGYTPEVFGNIGGTGSAFWQNLVTAVTQGTASRGPSSIVTASLPSTQSTSAPNVTTTYTLAGGTNGNASVTATTQVGTPSAPKTGMYALSGTEAAYVVLCDNDDASTFVTIDAFAKANNMYGMGSGPSGQYTNSSAAVNFFSATGVADYNFKFALGDWGWFQDNYNNVQRLVTPLAAFAGRLAVLPPNASGLSKPIRAFFATQSSMAGYRYDKDEIALYRTNGIDLIAFRKRSGRNVLVIGNGINTSSNPTTQDDSYTRLTNYLAATFTLAGEYYEGGVQTPKFWADEEGSLSDFLSNLSNPPAGIDPVIAGYDVLIDAATNPQSETSLGLNNGSISVQYFGIAVKVIFTFTGGSSVVISNAA